MQNIINNRGVVSCRRELTMANQDSECEPLPRSQSANRRNADRSRSRSKHLQKHLSNNSAQMTVHASVPSLAAATAGNEFERVAVGIVGAGLAGLALACGLQRLDDRRERSSVAVTVLEQTAELEPMLQTLQLSDAGVQALRTLGLWDEWLSIRQMDDSAGLAWPYTDSPANGFGWASRKSLLALLAKPLVGGTLRFGQRVVAIKPTSGNKLLCEFADGSVSQPFDLIVGADGFYSSVHDLFKSQRNALSRILLVGDARRPFKARESMVQAISRIQRGGNQAMQAAIELSYCILEHACTEKRSSLIAGFVPGHPLYAYSAELALSWRAWLRHWVASKQAAKCSRRHAMKT